MAKIWINGILSERDKAVIPVFDRGFLYGDGCFETMRSYAGTVFGIDAHLSRFLTSAKMLGIANKKGIGYFKKAIYYTIKKNKLQDAYIRLTMTRGEGRIGIGYNRVSVPTVVIIAKEFEGYPHDMYSNGIGVGIVKDMRQNEFSPVSRIKSSNFLIYILTRIKAQESGYDDAVLLNTKGFVTEASTSNIFALCRGRLITPSIESGVLPGITRQIIIDLAGRLRMRVREKRILPKELLTADEVFLTNSLAEIMPVTRINGKNVGDGKPGRVTQLLRFFYGRKVARETSFR